MPPTCICTVRFIGSDKLPDEESYVVRTLREATFEALEAVIALCIDRHTDFLLVAGDDDIS